MGVVNKGYRQLMHVHIVQRSHAGSIDVGERDLVGSRKVMRAHSRLVSQHAVVRHHDVRTALRIDRHHFFGCAGK